MPVDFESLQKEPDFKAMSPKDKRKLVSRLLDSDRDFTGLETSEREGLRNRILNTYPDAAPKPAAPAATAAPAKSTLPAEQAVAHHRAAPPQKTAPPKSVGGYQVGGMGAYPAPPPPKPSAQPPQKAKPPQLYVDKEVTTYD